MKHLTNLTSAATTAAFLLLCIESHYVQAQALQTVTMQGSIIEPSDISHPLIFEVGFPGNFVGQLSQATNWNAAESNFEMTIIDPATQTRWPIDSARAYHPPYQSNGGGCGGDYFAFWWQPDPNRKPYACNIARKPDSCQSGQGPTGAFSGRCSDTEDPQHRYFGLVMTPPAAGSAISNQTGYALTSSNMAASAKQPISAELSLQSNRIPINYDDPAYTVLHLDKNPAIYLNVTFADQTSAGPHDYKKQSASNIIFDDSTGDPQDLIQVVYGDIDSNQPGLGKYAAQLTSTGNGVGTATLIVRFRNAPAVTSSVQATVVSGTN